MMKNTFRISTVCSALLVCLPSYAAIDEGFGFHGYAKGGIGITNDAILNQGAYDWANNGINIFRLEGNGYTNSSGGRLGNEANWLEMHTSYGWAPQNDMTWGVKTNIVYGSALALDELLVEGSGVIPSNPTATFWAGKRYYNRVDVFLNDSQAMSSDGAGFGMDNFDLGFAALHLGVTRNLYDESPDNGEQVAFTSSLSDIAVSETGRLALYANYGTFMGPALADDNFEKPDDAFQLAAKVRFGDWVNNDEFFVRYSANTSASITRSWERRPDQQIGAFWQGNKGITDDFRISYLWQHETEIWDGGEGADKSVGNVNGTDFVQSHWNVFVLRNSYAWNQRTSTELELGYEFMDFKGYETSADDTNAGYKVTFSQNIHIGSGAWDRPVIRFFATYVDEELRFGYSDAKVQDALSFGAQFEAWW